MARNKKISLAPAFGVTLNVELTIVPEEPQMRSPLLTQEEKRRAFEATKALIEKFGLGVDLIQRPCNHLRSQIYYSLGDLRSQVTSNIRRDAVGCLAELLWLTFEDLQLGVAILDKPELLTKVELAAKQNDLFQKQPTSRYRVRSRRD